MLTQLGRRPAGRAVPIVTQPRRAMGLFSTPSAMPKIGLNYAFTEDRYEQICPSSHAEPQAPRVTKLPSGMTVVSTTATSPLATFTLLTNVGSRDIPKHLSGITQVIERMSFQSTKYRSGYSLVKELGLIGASVNCTSSVETMSHSGCVLRRQLPVVVEAISDMISFHAYHQWEVDEVIGNIAEDMQQEEKTQDALATALLDAAYGDTELGRSPRPTASSLRNINSATLSQFAEQFFVPQNMVAAASGVNHDEFVQLVESLFFNMPGAGQNAAASTQRTTPAYEGGFVGTNIEGSSEVSLSVAFPCGGWKSDDLYALSVLQMLLGGGDSFSSGGPGKGMHSRLYAGVLVNNPWLNSINSFNHLFSDTGLFGIQASTTPDHTDNLVNVVINEFQQLKSKPVSAVELQRAKNLLKSGVLMQTEDRGLLTEDLARQVMLYGRVVPIPELLSKIDAVRPEDITRVCKEMMKKRLSIGLAGDCSKAPSYLEVAKYMQ